MEDGKLYYTIGEVTKMLNLNASKLRFWEKEFSCINPKKGSRGIRFYTKENIETIKRIIYLTDTCGYTLEGVKEHLKSDKVSDERLEIMQNLTSIKDFLTKLKDEL